MVNQSVIKRRLNEIPVVTEYTARRGFHTFSGGSPSTMRAKKPPNMSEDMMSSVSARRDFWLQTSLKFSLRAASMVR